MFFYSEQLAPSDPYAGNVSVLLKGDGPNNSTNIIDSSANNLSITRTGDTKISTTESKFGGSSIYFDGNGDSISINNSNQNFAFGAGNFTIEMWVKPNQEIVDGQARMLFANRQTYFNYDSVTAGLVYNSSLQKFKISFLMSFTGTSWDLVEANSGEISPNVWSHLAFVRNGSEISVFTNGIKKVAGISQSSIYNGGHPFVVGQGALDNAAYGAYSMSGFIDDFRITKGVARYTENFTPPDAL